MASSASATASRAEVSAQVEIGDAFDLLPKVRPRSVDLILTSPPYWGHRSYSRDHNIDIHREWRAAHAKNDATPPPYDWYRKNGGVLGLEPFPEWYVSHLVELFELARPCLKPSGSMWINIGDTYFARWASIRDNGRQGLGGHPRLRRHTPMGGYRQEKQLLLIPARFAIAMQDRQWILRNDLIWSKPNIAPRPEVDRLRLAHEHFFHFVLRPKEGRAKYFYDISQVEKGARDVVTCTSKRGQNGHTATFPLDLIAPRILSASPPGGTILDPFVGSGRALQAAALAGRHAIGFEINREYARDALKTVQLSADE
jgi:site-specific DNA-methyltransferase (adenine-specific)